MIYGYKYSVRPGACRLVSTVQFSLVCTKWAMPPENSALKCMIVMYIDDDAKK